MCVESFMCVYSCMCVYLFNSHSRVYTHACVYSHACVFSHSSVYLFMCHSSCVRVNGYASESIEALTQWHYASESIEALTEWQYIHMCGMTHESIHWIAYSMTLRPPYSFITQHLFVFQNFLKNILELTLWCDITHLYELWLRSSYLCTHAHVLAYEWVIRLPILLLFSHMCVHKYELLSHRTHAYYKTYVCNSINCWVTWLLRDKTPE